MSGVVWLSTADLAERYRTDQGTIRYWRMQGTGPKGTVFGRRVLYRLSDVEQWEKAKEQAQHAPQAQGGARRGRV
jgi:hypothetical protein